MERAPDRPDLPAPTRVTPARRAVSPVHPFVDRLGATSWRLVGIGLVAWVALQLLGALRIVVFPLVAALLLTVVLTPPTAWLRRRGWRPLLAAWVVFLAFVGALALAGVLIVPPMVDGFANLGPTVSDAVDDVETWLVEDSPFDLDRARLEAVQEQAKTRIEEVLNNSEGVLLDTAVLALEIVAGLILTLVMTFFFLKDGARFVAWAERKLPDERRDVARRAAARGWRSVAGYLRGSALLGLIEASVIGLVLAVTGAGLIVPVMTITFVAAFVPFVGAVAAGFVAVAVALATAGPGPALIVGAVALAVQQFDNDLLAPVVFGKAMDLHPLVILVSVAAGGALAGIAGAFVAVPLTAVVINVSDELVKARSDAPTDGYDEPATEPT